MSMPVSTPTSVMGVAFPVIKHVLAIAEYVEGQFGSSSANHSLRSLFLGALIVELQSLQASTPVAS